MAETLTEARAKALKDPRREAKPISDTEPGKFIICLTRNESGYYMPCLAKFVHVTPSGRVKVDMYGRGEDFRVVSPEAVYTSPHCAQYDMSDAELIAALLAAFPLSEGVIMRLDRSRLLSALRSHALPYRVNDDGTAHWPCDAQGGMNDTFSEAVEVKTVDAVNDAIRAGREVWFNSDGGFLTGRKRADRARLHMGRVQVHDRDGWWDVKRSTSVYYDSER